MAYMSQERKKEIQKKIKPLLKRYGLRGSLAVRHHSTLVLNIREGGIDFLSQCNDRRQEQRLRAETHVQISHYHLESNWSGDALSFLREAFDLLNAGNHDHSDSQTDYFNVGWYVEINIGKWDRAYSLTLAVGGVK